jgi:hypothetical protein
MYKYLIFIVLLYCCNEKKLDTKNSNSKIVDTKLDTFYFFKGKVSQVDTSFQLTDEEMGVGDDGIYNLQEPLFTTNLNVKKDYSIDNISDWNLSKSFVFSIDSSIKNPIVFCEFDFSNYTNKKDTFFSIDNIFFYNGYRKSLKVWENNSRVKSLNIYINDKLKGKISLMDTYKLQIIDIEKLKLYCVGGEKMKISFEFKEFYEGKQYKNEVAISELELTGTRISD